MKSFLIFLCVGALIGAGLGRLAFRGDLPFELWLVSGIFLGGIAWGVMMVVRFIAAIVEKAER